MFVNMFNLYLCLQYIVQFLIYDYFFYIVELNKDLVVKKKRFEYNVEVVVIDFLKFMKIFCFVRFLYILILKKINCLNNVYLQVFGIINLSYD